MTVNGSRPSCSITSISGASGNGSHAARPSSRRGARAGLRQLVQHPPRLERRREHREVDAVAGPVGADATTISGRRPWIDAMRRAWPATASHRSRRLPATTSRPDGRLERQRLRQHRAQVARADNHRRHAVHPATVISRGTHARPLPRPLRSRAGDARRRGVVAVPRSRQLRRPDLHGLRRRRPNHGCRRQRVRRPDDGLRRAPSRARPSAPGRRRRAGAAAGHALRDGIRDRDRGRRADLRPRPGRGAGAVRQHRDRGHDGGDPDRPGADRPSAGRQVRGPLPRLVRRVPRELPSARSRHARRSRRPSAGARLRGPDRWIRRRHGRLRVERRRASWPTALPGTRDGWRP